MQIESTSRPHPTPLPEGEGVNTQTLALLREWSSVCDATAEGRNHVLIRKGGIAEGRGGFEIRRTFFGLLPTLFHQVKQAHPCADAPAPPATVTLICQLVDACVVPSATSMDPIAAFHAYGPEQLAKRQQYKPDRPLCVMIIRAFRLRQPMEIGAGQIQTVCRSWAEVPLSTGMGGIDPVTEVALSDTAIDAVRQWMRAVPDAQRLAL